MTVRVQPNPKFKAFVPGTNSLAVGYQLFTYEPGTSTKKYSFPTEDDAAKYVDDPTDVTINYNTNPIVLDGNGECDLWLNGKYKLVLAPSGDTDPPASPNWTMDNVGQADVSATTVGVSNKIENGSMEIDTTSTGVPDGWTLTPGASNTVARDTTDNWHGDSSLKFTIGGANTAIAETELFEVQEGQAEVLRWAMKASAVDFNLIMRMVWYTDAEVFLSNTDLYSNGSSNPTSWTDKGRIFTPPATARFAKLQIRGSTNGKSMNIDNVRTQAFEFHDIDQVITGQWSFDNGLTQFGSAAPGNTWAGAEVLELNATGNVAGLTGALHITENAYYDGAWKYSSTSQATLLQLYDGLLKIKNAASGIAGNAITWTESLSVESTGYVKGLGNNWLISPAGTNFAPQSHLVIHEGSSNSSVLQFTNTTTSNTANDGFTVGINGSEQAQFWNYENTDMRFGTLNTLRGKIAAAGQWLISPDGTDFTPQTDAALTIYENADTTTGLIIQNSATTAGAANGTFLYISGTTQTFNIRNYENADISFHANNTFRGKIAAAGNWLVAPDGSDVTPNRDLVLYNGASGATYAQWCNNTTGNASTDGFRIGITSAEIAELWNYENTDMNFAVNNLQEMYLDASNRGLAVGTPTGAGKGAGTINVASGYYVDDVKINSTAVTGFYDANNITIHDDIADATTFDIDSLISTAWESIGPTGAGATNTWGALDSVPSGASGVILKISNYISGSTTGSTYRSILYARRTGSTQATGTVSAVSSASFINRSGSAEQDQNVTTIFVPIDSSGRFDLYLTEDGTTPTNSVDMNLVGWIA